MLGRHGSPFDSAAMTLALTAVSLTEPQRELEVLKAALKKRFGREVELSTAIDASLIGGAVVRSGDLLIDGSMKGKLERLETELTG